MGYQVGSLEINLLGFSDSAVKAVDDTARSLGKLASAAKKINSTQLTHTAQVLEYLFSKIASSTNSINTKNIETLAIAAKSLSSIAGFSKLDKLDFNKVGKGFEYLSVAINPFLDKVKEAEASLVALDGVLRRTSSKKIQGLFGESKTSNRGGMFGIAKIGISAMMMRRLGRFMSDLVVAGSEYNETLNLWQVAMRNNLDTADQFVNKMQKAYGISTKTLMNAQAIFKNMVGALGNITDQTAYALSEALVQMSADFSSLYNVTLTEAFNKMQAMLSRQIRPIRSVSGLDISERTIYELYQGLGGTKTMRQLNNTEKQLLSILAVYRQMGASGALGDMTKTLNQFANQSRMMTEYWTELKTWTGLVLKDLIDQSGALVYINAALITVTEIMRSIARSRGLGEDNFINGLFETTEATNDAVDELQGKLLDFDKFRSLEGAGTSALAIDQKLLDAIAGYDSQIDQAQNAARKLADDWLRILGATEDANGDLVFTGENLERIENILKSIGLTVGIIVGLKFVPWLFKVATNAIYAGQSLNLLGNAVLGGAVYAILQAIDAFKEADYWGGVLYSVFGVALVGAFIALNKQFLITSASKIISFFQTLQLQGALAVTTMQKLQVVISYLGVATMSAAGSFMIFDGIISRLDGDAKRTVSSIAVVTGSLATLLGVILAIKGGLKGGLFGATVAGLGVGALLAGIKGMTEIKNYAVGASDIDSGTVFRAGEFGKVETVYTGSNGKTNVANVQQMEQAFYNALARHSRDGNGTIVVQAYLDGEKVYENTTARAKARGKVWAKA